MSKQLHYGLNTQGTNSSNRPKSLPTGMKPITWQQIAMTATKIEHFCAHMANQCVFVYMYKLCTHFPVASWRRVGECRLMVQVPEEMEGATSRLVSQGSVQTNKGTSVSMILCPFLKRSTTHITSHKAPKPNLHLLLRPTVTRHQDIFPPLFEAQAEGRTISTATCPFLLVTLGTTMGDDVTRRRLIMVSP